MSSGFIYVLVNSAMPGLLKVGKTTRSTAERAVELSASTGVATPFIVAFEQYFRDCDTAESYIHAELTRRGMREASNREFFRGSVNEAVRVILQASDSDNIGDPAITNDEASKWEANDPPWAGILKEADDAYYGFRDTIVDHRHALQLYLDAARLGCLTAYEEIGDIYRYGEEVPEDLDRSQQYYRLGAEKGNYYCYARLADLYEFRENTENARKAWIQSFRARSAAINDGLESSYRKYAGACSSYIMFFRSTEMLEDFARDLKKEGNVIRRQIINSLSDREARCRDDDSQYWRSLADALRWARGVLSEEMTDIWPEARLPPMAADPLEPKPAIAAIDGQVCQVASNAEDVPRPQSAEAIPKKKFFGIFSARL